MTNTEWMRNRLHAGAGLKPETPWPVSKSYKELLLEQQRDMFTVLMNHRMVMGHLRYGKSQKREPFRDINSAMARIKLYAETGNQEYLVDAANYLRLEFRHPTHPQAHWKAIDRV